MSPIQCTSKWVWFNSTRHYLTHPVWCGPIRLDHTRVSLNANLKRLNPTWTLLDLTRCEPNLNWSKMGRTRLNPRWVWINLARDEFNSTRPKLDLTELDPRWVQLNSAKGWLNMTLLEVDQTQLGLRRAWDYAVYCLYNITQLDVTWMDLTCCRLVTT